ncbi:ATP-binding protein [Longispora urticae]
MEEPARELLASLCADLRLLRTQAGGPGLRDLARRAGLGKSQVGAILAGRVRRPPDWRVVAALVEGVRAHAVEHGRTARLSLRTGVEEYWRPRYALLEHAFEHAAPVSAAPGPTPAGLPAAVPGFAGRHEALATLDDLLPGPGNPTPTGALAVVCGPAGVGKTALAVYWAHRVAARFPDGQLHVDLRGFAPDGRALDPSDALRGLLAALGVPAPRIPAALDDQVAVYRATLAGRRFLVVLDNARDAGQVRPLLPGAPGCVAVVTSRDQLTPLVVTEGARPVPLRPLTAGEARDLLIHRLGKDRVEGEPGAADEIVERCARLPLALAVVGARAATYPEFPLAALAAQLRDAGGPLDALDGGDPGTDVRAVFSWSYRAVSPAAAGLFRLLGLHPGPDISRPALASLAGVPPRGIAAPLAELTRAHLATEHAPGRYALHDLLRAYAAELADLRDPPDVRDGAVRRWLDHLLHSGFGAALRLQPGRTRIPLAGPRPGVTPERPEDVAAALAWFTAEHRVLRAADDLAAGLGLDTERWQLAWVLCDYLLRQGHRHEHHELHRAALGAAERTADPGATAYAHRGLALSAAALGRPDDARRHHGDALRLFASVGDLASQGKAYLDLGGLSEVRGRHAEALDAAERALDLYRRAGHRTGEARAHTAIGWCHALLGDQAAALSWCHRALDLHRDLDDREGVADTWHSLGHVRHELGEHGAAADCYREALDGYRALGQRPAEADTLTRLGDEYRETGSPGEARAAWREAAAVLEELGLPGVSEIRARLSTHAD